MKSRNIGLDILRILSMCGIIGLHIINSGGLLHNLSIYSYKFYLLLPVLILMYTSVNVFGLLSGYLCAEQERLNSKKIVNLILVVIFFCVVTCAVFYGLNINDIRTTGFIELIKNLFPPLDGLYWYITSYVFLFFMIPFLNIFIKKINKETFKKLLVVLFILLTIVPTIGGLVDYFKINFGYSPFWLMYCYLIGAYMKLYLKDIKETKKGLILKILALVLVTFILNVAVRLAGVRIFETVIKEDWFINYISPFILLISIGLLLLFRDIKLKNSFIQKIIIFLSQASFSVYIIHCQRIILYYIIVNKFGFLARYNGFIMLLFVIGTIITIYLSCAVIDVGRKIVFKILKLDYFSEYLGKKIDNILKY